MKKKKIELLDPSFSFDSFHIIGVEKADIWIEGTYYCESKDDIRPCLVVIDKKLLHKALDLWIKDKKSYCDSWNEFCGQMGSIRAKLFIELPTTSDDLRVFRFKTIGNYCDMEHG